MPRFIQIHTLASYPAALLNRDDAGMAKRLPYGGASRIRISSQCLKRHWRKAEDQWQLDRLDLPMAERSRMAIERAVMPEISGAPDVVEAVRVALVCHLYGKNAAKAGGDPEKEQRDRQALLLGTPELHYLTALAREAATAASPKEAEKRVAERFGRGDGKANLRALVADAALPAGLEGALFGRMVTSDPEANTDAAIHVAHAFTVHREESESDYFTVVDDLATEHETGSAGLFETELTSGLFYGYVVVDGPALIGNLGGDAPTAGRVVEHLLHLIATVSPGAKRGSTAPYGYADLMLVETGDRQPRSLAGAFRRPVPADGSADVLDVALDRLGAHLASLDRCYGGGEQRAALCTAQADWPGVASKGLDELAAWAGSSLVAA